VVDASCNGENDGEVTLSATGGTGNFQYSDDGNNYAGNPNFDNLLAGSYTFFVQDDNGCVQQASASVDEPEAIVVTGIVSEGSVTGEGSIDVTVTGGNLPYTYEWIGPGVSGQDGQDLEGISSGSYTIEVTDESGCSVTETFNITTIAEGCTDPAACNYMPNAAIDDSSCDYSCYGCTDPEALNYAPSATVDDGSCFYFDPSCDNLGDEGWEMFESGVYPGTTEEREFGVLTTLEFALHLADFVEEPASGQIFSVGSFSPENVVGLPSGLTLANTLLDMDPMSQQCVQLQGVPTQQGVFQVQVTGTLTILLFGAPYSISDYAFTQSVIITPNVNGIPGCMYSFATNYNVIATYDDGSCYIEGCADPTACNYNSFASVASGDCDYTCLGCTYPEASNYASSATLDDGSCEFAGGSCVFDTNGDQYVGSEDLLNFLMSFGTSCQ